jgi:hypothetical protein
MWNNAQAISCVSYHSNLRLVGFALDLWSLETGCDSVFWACVTGDSIRLGPQGYPWSVQKPERLQHQAGAVEGIQGLSQSLVVFDSKDANVGLQGCQRRTKDANTLAALQTASGVIFGCLMFWGRPQGVLFQKVLKAAGGWTECAELSTLMSGCLAQWAKR